MGVMACGRSNCEAVMCHIMVADRYMCSDCLDELRESRKDWPDQMTKPEFDKKIEDFYASKVGTFKKLDPVDIDAELDRITRRCGGG